MNLSLRFTYCLCSVDGMLTCFPFCFRHMDFYPFGRVRSDGWLYTNGLHRPGLTRLLWRKLQHFGYEAKPAYRGLVTHEFR
jgi:hypothetical protein